MKENPVLTVLCPGIRVDNWEKLYRSIDLACSRPWEIIFIGPKDMPEDFKAILWSEGRDNFKFVKDFGSPMRCQQIGLTFARGSYISWAADDGVYLPGMLDRAFDLLAQTPMLEGFDPKALVMGKYYEGNNDGDMPMQDTKYYILSNHDASRFAHLPVEYLMLNVGIVPTALLLEVGGWDAENFEVCPMAYNDLAIRLQNYGCKFIVQDEIMFKCSHLPGHAGDHGPIHDAQIYFDQPRFADIYSDPACKTRVMIKLENWRMTPNVWRRRFPANIAESSK